MMGVVGHCTFNRTDNDNEDTVCCRCCGILSRGEAIEFTDRYLVKLGELNEKCDFVRKKYIFRSCDKKCLKIE